MKKFTLAIITLLLIALHTQAQIKNLQDYFNKVDQFLATNVKSGKVNYKGIASNKTNLDELIAFAATKQKFGSVNEEKTFYLNTYNIAVIKGITNAYPVKSPMDIAGFFDKKTFTVNGATITLNGIENDIIRKKYNDARIHFALVCGAKSCPPLPSYAFKTEKLDTQLDALTKQSIQNSNFIKIDNKASKAAVSMLFNWYKDDFIKAKGSVINFLNAYLKTPLPATTTVEFYTYDWALNTQ
ncbi:DUF547 domain-containing protein [Ferruginibacter yonginensis]|uniref:DUF547 domain-containing protein n=1 Tax=Ferruginibacter yonginensis TaxID=1310416 RepID=A0ABV8QS59_9BACT